MIDRELLARFKSLRWSVAERQSVLDLKVLGKKELLRLAADEHELERLEKVLGNQVTTPVKEAGLGYLHRGDDGRLRVLSALEHHEHQQSAAAARADQREAERTRREQERAEERELEADLRELAAACPAALAELFGEDDD